MHQEYNVIPYTLVCVGSMWLCRNDNKVIFCSPVLTTTKSISRLLFIECSIVKLQKLFTNLNWTSNSPVNVGDYATIKCKNPEEINENFKEKKEE